MNIPSIIGAACAAVAIIAECQLSRLLTATWSHQSSSRRSPIFQASRSLQWLSTIRRAEPRSRTRTPSRLSSSPTLAGEIESQVNDGPKRVYRAGESFYETPGSSHPISRNASKTESAKLLAVFVVDTNDKPLTIPYK